MQLVTVDAHSRISTLLKKRWKPISIVGKRRSSGTGCSSNLWSRTSPTRTLGSPLYVIADTERRLDPVSLMHCSQCSLETLWRLDFASSFLLGHLREILMRWFQLSWQCLEWLGKVPLSMPERRVNHFKAGSTIPWAGILRWIKGERERTAAPISCSLTAEVDWWTQAPATKASPTGLAACSNCGLKYVPPSSSCFCLGYFTTAEERQQVQLLLRSWSQAKG